MFGRKVFLIKYKPWPRYSDEVAECCMPAFTLAGAIRKFNKKLNDIGVYHPQILNIIQIYKDGAF